MIVCENSGHIIVDDFPEIRKIVSAGATSISIINEICGSYMGEEKMGLKKAERIIQLERLRMELEIN